MKDRIGENIEIESLILTKSLMPRKKIMAEIDSFIKEILHFPRMCLV